MLLIISVHYCATLFSNELKFFFPLNMCAMSSLDVTFYDLPSSRSLMFIRSRCPRIGRIRKLHWNSIDCRSFFLRRRDDESNSKPAKNTCIYTQLHGKMIIRSTIRKRNYSDYIAYFIEYLRETRKI